MCLEKQQKRAQVLRSLHSHVSLSVCLSLFLCLFIHNSVSNKYISKTLKKKRKRSRRDKKWRRCSLGVVWLHSRTQAGAPIWEAGITSVGSVCSTTVLTHNLNITQEKQKRICNVLLLSNNGVSLGIKWVTTYQVIIQVIMYRFRNIQAHDSRSKK